MYRKKEILYGVLLFIVLFVVGIYNVSPKVEEKRQVEIPIVIEILVTGEVVRDTKLSFNSGITYGVLLIKIRNILNEYSDISNFDYYQKIDKNSVVTIKTKDVNNNYKPNSKICINKSSKEELLMLYQIGEKRAEKILKYIKENGEIKTWDEFFKITNISEKSKDKIMEQAFL